MAFACSVSSVFGAALVVLPLFLVLSILPVAFYGSRLTVVAWQLAFLFDCWKTELEVLDMRKMAAAAQHEKSKGLSPKRVYMVTEAVKRWQWHCYKWSLRLDWVVTLIYGVLESPPVLVR